MKIPIKDNSNLNITHNVFYILVRPWLGLASAGNLLAASALSNHEHESFSQRVSRSTSKVLLLSSTQTRQACLQVCLYGLWSKWTLLLIILLCCDSMFVKKKGRKSACWQYQTCLKMLASVEVSLKLKITNFECWCNLRPPQTYTSVPNKRTALKVKGVWGDLYK